MKYVLFYEGAEGFREKVPLHIEAHRALWREFGGAGTLLMVGPFVGGLDEPAGGAMAVFTTRAAAEAFAKADPFVTGGVVGRWTIREWKEALVPEGP